MARIAVIGGTGYSGSHIAAEAAARGHQVTSFSRSLPAEPLEGVSYEIGSIEQPQALVDAIGDVDVVVFAVSPRGGMEGKTRSGIRETIELLAPSVRVGVVGGAGSSLVAPGGARVMDEGFPPEVLPEATEIGGVLDDLRERGDANEWFYVHPAGGYGSWAPGERTGSYRIGGDVIVVDENGESNIGGEDFAIAFVDEIENRKHIAQRFTVGY
ncbi:MULTISPECIES: NAD(P)-dependent oxidoreductase [Microbacterium]|uniref:NAD(P)-dependent oxidoreductase n=1 Tax=Microbacterium TaxID=33882 RepID=UPI001E337270|nr:NAD(P)H-binding protein [Microbacterium nymphoidis]MCD2499316.1 NAD(P)H-binding protein [Microbacterium nymphoidis]